MAEIVFLDANVLLYLFSANAAKAGAARACLEDERLQRIVSTQVVAEFVVVSRRKFGLVWDEAAEYVELFRAACEVVPLTSDIQDIAFSVSRESNLHWYDAQIVAAALSAGANRLLTEDMQAGRTFGGMTVVNPFA